jgi:hypothetical protein
MWAAWASPPDPVLEHCDQAAVIELDTLSLEAARPDNLIFLFHTLWNMALRQFADEDSSRLDQNSDRRHATTASENAQRLTVSGSHQQLIHILLLLRSHMSVRW